MEEEANSILHAHGYEFNLKEKQLEIIESIMRQDTYAVLPTGYGKSVCFMLPPLILKKRNAKTHTALVISPLKALIKNQVQNFQEHNIAAHGIYEGMEKDVIDDIKRGNSTVLLGSPEAILSSYWKEVLTTVYSDQLCMVAYDEVHCISEWGLDFRADYRKVGLIHVLFQCPVLTLTATSTKEIMADVQRVLGMDNVNVVATLPDRPNVSCVSTNAQRT